MYSVLATSDDATQRTHEVYGSARMGMPQMASMFLAGDNEENHSGFEQSTITTRNWSLNEKFDNKMLFQVNDPNSNQAPQLSFAKGSFKYNKVTTRIKTRFPNTTAKPQNVDAMVVPELSKAWDVAAMMGNAGNEGFIDHSKAIKHYKGVGQKPTSWAQVKEGMSQIITDWAKAGLSSRKDLSQCRLMMGINVYQYLSETEDAMGKSLLDKFDETYSTKLGLQWELAPEHISDLVKSKMIGVLTPVVRFHHGALPSVYNNFENTEDDYKGSNYASQSTGVEVETEGGLSQYDFAAK